MFYEELYPELGKLFYYLAAADGKVTEPEKKSLRLHIQNNWKPLENSTDKFGTDLANLIGFAFDYEEAEGITENGYQSFERFYKDNKLRFNRDIISNTIQTAKAIASAYKGSNKSEKEVLNKIITLFETKN